MKRRWDDSIQSSNTPTYQKLGISREDYMLYRCMVIKVLYVDDPSNITKNSQNPEVLYEVIILGGSASGQTLSNCRLASWLGGNSNYSERTLTPTSKDVSKVKLSQHDGDIVYVEFVQGHDAYPVILGLAKGISNKIASSKADGPRFLEQFNGLETNINNRGEFTVSRKGGSLTEGRFSPNSSFDVKFSLTENKMTITTKGGAETIVDGASNKVSIKAGSTEVLIDGSSGKISLKGEMVDLGTSVSDFVTLFTQLATAFNSHTHMGNLGAPTSPPMAPLLSTVGSQTVKVQP